MEVVVKTHEFQQGGNGGRGGGGSWIPVGLEWRLTGRGAVSRRPKVLYKVIVFLSQIKHNCHHNFELKCDLRAALGTNFVHLCTS